MQNFPHPPIILQRISISNIWCTVSKLWIAAQFPLPISFFHKYLTIKLFIYIVLLPFMNEKLIGDVTYELAKYRKKNFNEFFGHQYYFYYYHYFINNISLKLLILTSKGIYMYE